MNTQSVSRIRSILGWLGLLTAVLTVLPASADADYFEYSLGFSYSRSEFAGGAYSWNRRWGTSLGYNIGDLSTLELSFQDNFDRTHYPQYEDSFYHDRVYSLNWVQHILGKEWNIRPYFKLGVGQLNRNASVLDNLGRQQTVEQDSVTGVIGLGSKFMLTKTFALRIEGTSYLSGGKFGSWQDNVAFSIGGSIYF